MRNEFQCLKGTCREMFLTPKQRDEHTAKCDGKRKCNRHSDCDAAKTECCHSDDCEDCFPK